MFGTLTQATAGNGIATFTNVNIQLAGTYTLQAAVTAAGSGVSSVTSSSFTINVGPATKLAFLQQPTDNTVGNAFSPPVTVEIQDAYGNVRADNGTNVTISTAPGTSVYLTGNTATTGADGAGGTPGTAGIATFDQLVPYGASQTAQLVASAPGLTSATSSSYNFTGSDVDTVVFSTEPANTTAGVTMSEVDVTATSGGSPVPFVGVTLSVSSGTGPLNGTLTQVTDGSGVAHFTDLSFNAAGDKQLTATAGSASGTSSTFTISPATAAKLVIAQQPSTTGVAGVALAAQPAVLIEDTFGNVVSNSVASVTASELSGGNLSATSGNTVVVGVANGAANYSGLYLTNGAPSGTANQLVFSDTGDGLTSVTSSVVTIYPAVPGIMTIQTQPSSTAAAGTAFATQPVVKVQDAFGNTVSNSTPVSVSASVGNLQGTTTKNTSSGLATFTNLALTNAGTGITLTFTSGSATATSSGINVSAGAITQVGFATSPGGATNSVAFVTQPVVQTYDAYGNPSVNNLPATMSVTVSLASGTGPLAGTTTMNIGTSGGNGTATFTNLKINAGGTDTLAVAYSFPVPSGAPVWLDANNSASIAFSSGTTVKTWGNLGTRGGNVGAPTTTINGQTWTGPALVTNSMNGKPVVRFTATGTGQNGGNVLTNTWAGLDVGPDIHVFMVVRQSANEPGAWSGWMGFSTPTVVGGKNNATLSEDAGNGTGTTRGFRFFRNDATGNQPLFTASGQFTSNMQTLDGSWENQRPNLNAAWINQFYFSGGSQAGADSWVDQNGNSWTNYQSTATTSYPNFNITDIGVGAQLGSGGTPADGPAWGMSGDMAEVMVYTNVLSATDRAAVFSYLQDKWFGSFYSNGLSQSFVVAPASSANSLAATPNPALPGATVNLTNTVSAVSPATNLPTGSVVFLANGTPFSTNTLSAGVTYASTASLPHGSNAITVQYSGDVNLNASTTSLGVIVDTPPTGAANYAAQTTVNTPLDLSAGKTLMLASDADGDTVTFVGVTATSTNGGTVVLNGDTITYTPRNNYVGADALTYTLNDGLVNGTGTIYLTVLNNAGATNLVSSVVNNDGSVTLSYAGIPGNTYHVQVASNLATVPIVWTDLTDSTNTADSNGLWNYTDTHTGDFSPRFYRTVSP